MSLIAAAIGITIEPKDAYASANIRDHTEFHCQVSGMLGGGGSEVRWAFIPEGATEEQPLPGGCAVSTPEGAPTRSFLLIGDPTEAHKGQYVCRVKDKQDIGRLFIEDRGMS